MAEFQKISGICGYASPVPLEKNILGQICDTLQPFGNKHCDVEQMQTGTFSYGLAQSIVITGDKLPSTRNNRPSDASISVVLFGRLSNTQEILLLLGTSAALHRDSDIIAAAYQCWGLECLSRLRGEFSFALYDHKNDILLLARDQIGKKPLYFWQDDRLLVFASEMKPIMAYPGFPKKIRKEVVSRYLYQGYIAAPDTIFENVYKLPAGQFITMKQGVVRQRCYWNLVDAYHSNVKQKSLPYPDAQELLHKQLLRATQPSAFAGLKIGAFLSGGYDSTLIAALANSQSQTPLKTFCMGFYEEGWNEAGYAKAVAQHLGTSHTELFVEEAQMQQVVENIPLYYDEPFADNSQVPTLLATAMAGENTELIFSGDGGDELFCGYPTYAKLDAVRRLDVPGAALYALSKLPMIEKIDILSKLPSSMRVIAENRDRETKTQFGNRFFSDLTQSMAGVGLPERYREECALQESNWQVRRMLLDMKYQLPDNMLCKVERAATGYHVEVQSPLLDVSVMEYAFTLPHGYKYAKGVGKRILKEIVYQYVPKELMERPKKGFDVPAEKWLRTTFKERMLYYAQEGRLQKQGVFSPQATSKIVAEFLANGETGPGSSGLYAKIMWAFLIFQMWHEKYIGDI